MKFIGELAKLCGATNPQQEEAFEKGLCTGWTYGVILGITIGIVILLVF